MQPLPLAAFGLGMAELLILSVFVVPWLLALVDCLKSDFKEPNLKVIWILVLLLIPILSWILYFAIGRGQKKPVR